MTEKKDANKEAAELRSLYELTVRDIENAKRRQWATTYYGLLTLAAVIIFYNYKMINSELSEEIKLFFLLLPAFLINLLCMWHIIDTHRCMCEYRLRLKEINGKFEKMTQDILCIQSGYTKFSCYFISLTMPLSILLTLGLFFVGWRLFGQKETFSIEDAFMIFLALTLSNSICFALFSWYQFEKYKTSEERIEQCRKGNNESKRPPSVT